MMSDWLNNTNRRIRNQQNQEQGRQGERIVETKYRLMGYKVQRTGRGHDYKVSQRNPLTGEKRSKFVEVKTGNSELSPLQKRYKKHYGNRYVVERLPGNRLYSSKLGLNTKSQKQIIGKSAPSNFGSIGFSWNLKKPKRKTNSSNFW